MEEKRDVIPVVTIGGKGSSLTSASVFAIANRLAHVRVDSSALDKLSQNPSVSSRKFQFKFPQFLTLEEVRASLTVLLNKLVISNPGIRPLIPNLIVETLNLGLGLGFCNGKSMSFDEIDVSDEEMAVLEKSMAELGGICAILDHEATTLSAVADTVAAALSCEALRADVSAFGSVESGDKDEIGVVSDMKVLLVGSKLVGKVEFDSVSEIPKVHGSFREVVRSVHSKARVELNSGFRVGNIGKGFATTVFPLAVALRYLGESSFCRAKLGIDLIGNVGLIELYNIKCPSFDSLKDGFKLASQAAFDEDYVRFLHETNVLLAKVREIFVWEVAVAMILLEGNETSEKSKTSRENVNVDKKSEKKKKVVLGKGTVVIMQLLKDKLQSEVGDLANGLALMEKWAHVISSSLDPKDPEFDGLLKRVKEIVESNESRRLPKLPKGTRDFAKEQMAVREKAFSIVMNVFKRHGATALDTPVFEMRETLMGKYGEDSKLIYDLADQGGELCSLRYDLTVPFARYMAMNGITSLKRYQIAKVYRRDNPSKGRFREFYQCDFDIAGQYETMGPDFEVIKILTEVLDELDIGEYDVKFNHRKLLDGMLDICGVPAEKFRTICSSIDKLDKQSFEQIKKEMVEEKGLSVETADKIGTFVKERGPPLELLSKLKQEGSKFLENKISVVALNELDILFKALDKAKCIDKVVFDLSLARGLDYYTGVIYEAVFKGSTQVGSIAAGGRYDNLIGMFGTKQVPAVGVSLGIERVFAIMEQQQKDQKQGIRATETQVLVSILWDDLSQAAELVSELWSAKLKAEYMVNKRVMKHFDRAKESRIPWIVFMGEREMNDGVVNLKDTETKEEQVIPRSKIIEELQRRLNVL